MTRTLARRARPALAVAIAGLAIAGTAVAGAHPGAGHGHGPKGRAACEIAPAKLATPETSPQLARADARLDRLVAAGRISQERADAILARRAIHVTLRTARIAAHRAPLLELLGMTWDELRQAVRDSSFRAVLDDKGVTRRDLRDALRQGRRDARAAVKALCASGAAEQPAA